jgi:hypothetical protein
MVPTSAHSLRLHKAATSTHRWYALFFILVLSVLAAYSELLAAANLPAGIADFLQKHTAAETGLMMFGIGMLVLYLYEAWRWRRLSLLAAAALAESYEQKRTIAMYEALMQNTSNDELISALIAAPEHACASLHANARPGCAALIREAVTSAQQGMISRLTELSQSSATKSLNVASPEAVEAARKSVTTNLTALQTGAAILSNLTRSPAWTYFGRPQTT